MEGLREDCVVGEVVWFVCDVVLFWCDIEVGWIGCGVVGCVLSKDVSCKVGLEVVDDVLLCCCVVGIVKLVFERREVLLVVLWVEVLVEVEEVLEIMDVFWVVCKRVSLWVNWLIF